MDKFKKLSRFKAKKSSNTNGSVVDYQAKLADDDDNRNSLDYDPSVVETKFTDATTHPLPPRSKSKLAFRM